MEYVLEKRIGNYIKFFAIVVFTILFVYVVYDNNRSKEQIKSSTKTKDSLEALINKYQYDYIELKKRADKMDSVLNAKKDDLQEVKNSFNKKRKPTIKNSNEAIKYINKFLSE
jgi:chlorite dismutase